MIKKDSEEQKSSIQKRLAERKKRMALKKSGLSKKSAGDKSLEKSGEE